MCAGEAYGDGSGLAGRGSRADGIKRAADGEVFDEEIVTKILSDLARLARGIGGRDQRLYCWMA